jgi:myo-inositol-1(or 4)-monophosphatase
MTMAIVEPKTSVDLDAIAITAVRAARKAGVVQHDHFRRELKVTTAEQHDIKLVVDRLCEKAIIEEIRETFPDHAILSEESGTIESDSPYVWIVDPLDGTVNYFQGFPYYCTSVSCYRRKRGPEGVWRSDDIGQPLAGVVYSEQTDELFSAARGRGARLNGRALYCPDIGSLSEAIVSLSIGSTPEIQAYSAKLIADLAPRIRKVRSCGATALDLVNIAAGRFHGLIQRRVRTWDIAAASLILAEAGGAFTANVIGSHRWDIVASAPSLHEQLTETACLS